MKKKVHIVNHTHWDREWYFTTMDAFLLSDNLFNNVIDELLQNPEAKFCLDGQSSILDDYMRLNPQQLENVKKLVANKQLAIGPWYTQTDAFFVDEESLIRNMIIGIRDSRKYGEEMKIGYLPDTFGHNAQWPTVLQHCGLDNIVFLRGLNLEKHTQSPYFTWKGLGEKEITAMNLVDGYGAAAFLKDEPEYIEERLLPAVKRTEKWTDINDLLLTAGGDQLEIIRSLPQTLKAISEKTDYDFIESSYEEFLDVIKKEENLPEYRGEFREPCTTRAHKSIGSVRYDIKRTNFIIEQKLLKRVEPLLAIGKAHGITLSTETLLIAWKKILEGHAHDSMGGCVSDDVAVDILHRMKEAEELADGMENYIVKRLSEKLGLSDKEILVFNTTSKDFKGYKQIDFLAASKNIKLSGIEEMIIVDEEYFAGKDNLLLETPEGNKYINEDPYYRLYALAHVEIPSMGYKIYTIEESQEEIEAFVATNDGAIKNEYYTINNEAGKLSLLTTDGVYLENFLEFEDMGNDGDTYDFSPLKDDKAIILNLTDCQVHKTSLAEKMVLSGQFQLPKTLEDRLESQNMGSLSMTLTLSLKKSSELIEGVLVIDNQVLSHRLRLKINTGVKNTRSIASLPFGFISREALTEEIPNWFKSYVEYPIDLEPFDKSVSVEDEHHHVSAFGKGLKEYQFQEGSLYLTLLATTSQLGKPNLAYRPGRASGDTTKKGHVMMPTPMAELLGEQSFEFALVVNAKSFNEFEAAQQWSEYTSANIAYQNQVLNKFIHRLDNKIQADDERIARVESFSLLKVDGSAFDTTFMPSLYDSNAEILRLANPTGDALPIGSFDFSKYGKHEFVNAQETVVEAQSEIAPYDMVSIKLWRN